MPRRKVIYSPDFPYHISARCHNKEWFDLPMSHVWETMSNYLFFIAKNYDVEIISFVLMSNHFHLLARFPKNNMAEAMNYFMRETSRKLSRDAGRINQTYGGRYFKSAIMKDHYFQHAYKYVYRNPVEGFLANRVEDYPYSTLQCLLGKNPGVIPLVEDPFLRFENIGETLLWLNSAPNPDDKEEVRKALNKTEFSLTGRKGGQFVHHLEVDSY